MDFRQFIYFLTFLHHPTSLSLGKTRSFETSHCYVGQKVFMPKRQKIKYCLPYFFIHKDKHKHTEIFHGKRKVKGMFYDNQVIIHTYTVKPCPSQAYMGRRRKIYSCKPFAQCHNYVLNIGGQFAFTFSRSLVCILALLIQT